MLSPSIKTKLLASLCLCLSANLVHTNVVCAQNKADEKTFKFDILESSIDSALNEILENPSPVLSLQPIIETDKKLTNTVPAPTPKVVSRSTTQTIIPNGQELLFRPKVDKLIFDRDIFMLKENDQLYVSLADAIDVLGIAVDYDTQSLKGNGWFFREDWRFNIDVPENKAVSRGQEFNIDPVNIIQRGSDTFVAQSEFEKWFDVSFDPDFSQQYVEISSSYPLPSVAKYYRDQKKSNAGRRKNVAQLPRKETENSWLDINTAALRLGSRFRRTEGGNTLVDNNANLALEGQALGHQAYLLANADFLSNIADGNGVKSVVARLSRRDEDAVLLGPLKAREYVIGDTNVTRIPLTGGSRQELGVQITNSSLDNTDFETTDINGNAIPGWDVELYRNDILTGTAIVGNDGYYEFAEIPLFGGDNKFEVFFYGPQGEIRSELINIPVTAALLRQQNNTYELSASLSDTRTYQDRESNDVDRETPHIAARFNKAFGNTLGYIGLRNRDVEGNNKTFVGTGFTAPVFNSIIDGNFGIDDEANTAAQIRARKNLYDWNLSASALVQDEEYAPDSTLSSNTLLLSSNAQRSFKIGPGRSASVSAQAQYQEDANSQQTTRYNLGLGHQFNNITLSNNLGYEDRKNSVGGTDLERLEDTFSVRANLGKYFIRGGVDYDIKPVSQVDKYFSQIHYQPTYKVSGDFYLDHEPDRDFTEARLNMNYRHKNFTTSPFVQIDSDSELYAGVNLNVNLIDDPNEKYPVITGKRVVGRGQVSSFVYHDKNGNLIFDENDEPLPEVIVQSLNVKRRAETNAKGYSLIDDLPSTRATDIVVDKNTLPDPYMISAVPGSSVFPESGEVYELEFPIHMAGEIDGTVEIKRKNGTVEPAKFAKIIMVPVDGKRQELIEVEAAFDGFYVVSDILPGEYLMTIAPQSTKKFKASAPPPQIVKIGYEGDALFGQNIQLTESRYAVPVSVKQAQVSREALNIPANKPLYSLLVTKTGKSRLLVALQNLSHKGINDDLFKGLRPIDMKFTSDNDRVRYMMDGNDVDQAYARCQAIMRSGMKCEMEILTRPLEQKNIKTASR